MKENNILKELEKFKKDFPNNKKFITHDTNGDEWICYITNTGDSWERARRGLLDARPVLAIDMDLVLADFYKAYYKRKEEDPEIKYPQSEYGFFENLEPLPGAIDAYHKLKTKYNVKILTAPSARNPLCYTEKRNWVERHLGTDAVYRLTITKDKHLFKADILIDDTPFPRFEGEQLLFGSEKFPNWESVLRELGLEPQIKIFRD